MKRPGSSPRRRTNDIAIGVAALLSPPAGPPSRAVAITIDDLPMAMVSSYRDLNQGFDPEVRQPPAHETRGAIIIARPSQPTIHSRLRTPKTPNT